MAVTLEGGCRVSQLREGKPLSKGTLCIWNRIGRATGAQAISLQVMEFQPGVSPVIKNDDCDQILFVVDPQEIGPGDDQRISTQFQLLINDIAFVVTPNTGVYVRPNQTFAIDNPGPKSILIISSQCPDPNRQPTLTEAVPFGNIQSGDGPMVRLADRPSLPTADRWYRVLVDEEIGSTQVTQFVGSIPPGRAPDHFHQYEEVLFILRGQGRMWAGETNTPIKPGSCIYLPRGQVHCVENTGKSELRLLGVFYPAGSPSVRYETTE